MKIQWYTLKSKLNWKLITTVLEALAVVPHKYEMKLTFKVEDNATNLLYDEESYTDADTKLTQLDTWASSAGTLTTTGCIDMLNGKTVKIEPASIRMLKHIPAEVNKQKKNIYICQATLIEV